MTKVTLIIAALAVLAAATTPAHAAQKNLIANGDFETPVEPGGTLTNFSIGQKFGGWLVIGRSGQVSIVAKTVTENGFTLTPQSGNQFLEFGAAIDQGPFGVEQTVHTKAGSTYVLTFWVGNVYNPNGGFGGMAAIDVYVDRLKLGTAINPNGKGTKNQVWTQFSLSFTASGDDTVIDFLDSFAGGLTGLDNIVLTTAP